MNDAVRQHLHDQGKACEDLGSPFTARVCHLLAENIDETTETGKTLLNWPQDPTDDNLGARLCGALRTLVLSGADVELAAVYPPNESSDSDLLEALMAAIQRFDARIAKALTFPPQTNETARAAMLLPGFLLVARETGLPLALNEIGSSAGLNQNWDKFRYDYDGRQWGDPASAVWLQPEVRGKAPPLEGDVTIASRRGADIAPISIDDDEAVLRLRGFVWAGQTARMERLDAALDIARRNPPVIDKADAADWIEQRLATRKPGEAFVLFHSIVWPYLPHKSRQRIEDLLARESENTTAESPICWLRMEPPHQEFAALWLTIWPGGETRQLANADFHGRWIEWLE